MAGNDVLYGDLPAASALTGAELVSMNQSGVTSLGSSQAIADLANTSPPPQYGNYVVQGGGVNWLGTGFQFTISAANYVIGGTAYSSAQTNLTNAAADPTNPRIDVFALTTSGTAVIIQGTPAASPAKPAVDSATQLEIGFVFIAAAATTPAITDTNIYLNNTEWTAVSSTVRINVDSTNNPFAGAKDIEATLAVAGDNVTLTNGSPVAIGNSANLVLQLRSKATWATAKRLSLQWRSGVSNVGTPVLLRTGVYGFNSATVGSYQSLSIPVADFNVGTSLADNLYLSVVGGGAGFGWYLDNIILQAGTTSGSGSNPGSDMTYRGAYVATTSYNVMDVVTSGGVPYVALQAGTGNAVTVAAFWDRLENWATELNAATGKTTPVDADTLGLGDSSASFGLKKLTWANLKATLKTYFDTLYQALNSNLTTLAGLTATTDNFIVSVASAWASRTPAQAAVTLQADGNDADACGFRGVPGRSFSANTTTTAADMGKSLDHPASDANARTATIDSNANMPVEVGSTVSFSNMAAQVVTIAITSDTMYLAGTGTTGSRSLAQYGTATARKLTSTTWLISGVGLT